MRQTNVRGNLSLRGFRKLRTGAIVATGVILLGLGFLAPTVSANEQDGVWVARTVAEVKADIQHIDNLSHYTIKWGDTLSAISGATGLSVDSLVEINRIANRDLIFTNNKLYFSEEAFLKDGNTEVKRQRVSIDNSGSRQSYEVETKTDTVTGEQTTTVKQTTPVVVEPAARTTPKAEEPAAGTTPKAEEPAAGTTPKAEAPAAGTTPKAEAPAPAAGTTPKAEEPAAGTTPKAEEPVAGTTPKAEEPAAGTTPKAEEPAAGTTPKAEEPVAGTTPKAEEPAAGTTPKAEEPAAGTTPKAEESAAGTTPKAEESAAGTTPKAEEPATSNPAPAPKDEKLEEAKKDGKDVIEKIAASKLSEIEKVKDEVKKEKLKAELKTLKEDALAAIKNAKNHDAAVAATDEYQTKIDGINVPGEELPAPNYNKDNLTNGRNEGTTIDNGSTVIGHGSGEATATTPTQPSSTSGGTTGFRSAPSVQARARRVARSTSEPDGTVNISYNFAGMPDIHGFLSDPGENNTVTIPAGTSEAQAKELVKEKIQAKIKDLAARGYYVKNDIIFEQDTTVKNYNYVVTFTKEATGTSGFRMAPAVQPRASRNRRSIEQPVPQKVKVNVFYNFDQMKDIAGFLGDINGTSLEIAEGLSNEQVKAAVKNQVEAKKEELGKRGYTLKEDYVYQANGKDYNYVVTFAKAAK